MQTRWIGKNVNLRLLRQYVKDFFIERGFTVKLDKSEGQTTISAVSRNDNVLVIVVKIEGKPEGFTVGFEGVNQMGRSMQIFSPFLVMFGLGEFVKRKLKSLHIYQKLEEEFFVFMEQAIAVMVGSASSE